jgi:Uma2 family endonuclease
MEARRHELVSVEQFIDWVIHQEGRYELVGGEVRMMTGATNRHNDVKNNVTVALTPAAKRSGCRATTSDTGIRTGERSLRYPDVVIDCGPKSPDATAATAPAIIVEVSSPGTRESDITVKLWEYQHLVSAQVIIQIEPDVVFVAVHRRGPAGWQVETHEDLDTVIDLPQIQAGLSLRDVYDGVDAKLRAKLQLVDGDTPLSSDR